MFLAFTGQIIKLVYKKGDLRFLPGTEPFQFSKNTGCPGKYGASGNPIKSSGNPIKSGIKWIGTVFLLDSWISHPLHQIYNRQYCMGQ